MSTSLFMCISQLVHYLYNVYMYILCMYIYIVLVPFCSLGSLTPEDVAEVENISLSEVKPK